MVTKSEQFVQFYFKIRRGWKEQSIVVLVSIVVLDLVYVGPLGYHCLRVTWLQPLSLEIHSNL